MDRLRLDFQRHETPLPRLGLLALAIGIVAVAASGAYYIDLRQGLSDWEGKSDQLERTARQRGLRVGRHGREGDDTEKRIERANAVIHQLNVPWSDFFDAIEAAGSKDVALLTLAPTPEKQLVEIGIEAKDANAALDYLRRLEARPVFRNVQLESHQIQLQDPDKPIRLTLQATWKGLP